MAADYANSTQRLFWQRSKAPLSESTAQLQELSDLRKQYPLPDSRWILFYFHQQIGKLGRRLTIRQPVLATAMIFLQRFYSRVEIRRTNPYLMLSTAFYLACKIEECPQHIRVVVSEARTLWSDLVPNDTVKLGECEFVLISEMNAQLIVYHPYRKLQELQSNLSLSTDKLNLAWSVVNDHYATDLPMIFSPNIIAAAAVVLAMTILPTQSAQTCNTSTIHSIRATKPPGSSSTLAVLQDPDIKAQRLLKWLSQSDVELEGIVECIQSIISLYTVLERYSEKDCRESLSHFIKSQGLEK